ncbi:MAG: tetratricopeptide repeat protein [Duncaniella sp.]|nr:tetratricopeptide repeat protein [Duncaniella sp.]
MKRNLILAALGAAALSAAAGVNPGAADAWLSRGIEMYASSNYQGCIDQLSRLYVLSPTAEQAAEAQYYVAMASLRSGDTEGEVLMKLWLKANPVSPRRSEALSALGLWYYAQGEYGKALDEYRLIAPGSLEDAAAADVKFHTAYCLMMTGERSEAARIMAEVMTDGEWGNQARFYTAYMAYLDNDYDRALRLFESVNTGEGSPADAAPYYMAQIYFSRADYDRALSIATRLLQEGKVPAFHAECNRIAGESLYNLDRESEAVPYLWKYCAETTDPQPGAFYILGVSEYRAGHYDDAIKLLQRAIGNPSAMEQSAWLFLGQAYAARSESDKALMAFEKAYRLDFDRDVRETAFYNYVAARMNGGRVPFSNTASMLNDFLEEFPHSRYADDVQRSLISHLIAEGDYQSVLTALDRIPSSAGNPDMIKARQRALFVLGTRDFAAGKTAAAMADFEKARAIEGGDPSVEAQTAMWLGDCAYDKGNFDTAARWYEAYLKTPTGKKNDYNHTLALYDLGYALMDGGNHARAAKTFDEAIAARTPLPAEVKADAYVRAADCRYYTLDLNGALAYYRKALELNPTGGDYALYQSAIMTGLLKKHAEKITLLDRLAAEYPSSGLLPAALLEKAESMMATGRRDDAVKVYTELVEKYPATVHGRKGHLQLAITYLDMGRRNAAMATYRDVITTYPTSEEARLASEDLKKMYAADGRLSEYASFIASVPDAPAFDVTEMEQLAFAAAETDFMERGLTEKLTSFVDDYPRSVNAPRAMYYLAEAAWNEGDPVTAVKYTDRLLSLYPDSETIEEALLIKARAEASLGKTEPALDSFTALERRASNPNMQAEARMGIISTALALDRNSQVVEAADRLLSSASASKAVNTSEIRFSRALALDRMGEHDRAYEAWRELATNPADLYGARSAVYLAQSLLDNGRTAEAATVADALISSDTPHSYWLARGFIVYSDILRKKGDAFEADEYLKSLRDNYPGTEPDIFKMINDRLKK